MNDDFEVTGGKGDVFHEFGYADADAEHLKAVLRADQGSRCAQDDCPQGRRR
jgi:hypothetical protein